jgi:hypothetical protein
MKNALIFCRAATNAGIGGRIGTAIAGAVRFARARACRSLGIAAARDDDPARRDATGVDPVDRASQDSLPGARSAGVGPGRRHRRHAPAGDRAIAASA